MIRNLYPERILVFHDTPVLFTARDTGDALYLCMLVDQEKDSYASVRITPSNLSDLLASRIDLREVFLNPVMGNEYFIVTISDQSCIISDSLDRLEECMIPEEGFFIGEDVSKECDVIDLEVIRFNTPVVHLGVVDASNSHSITLDKLSLVSEKFQSMMRRLREKIDPNASDSSIELRLFDSSAASFNMHLKTNAQPDMFGVTEIDHTLEFMHALLSSDLGDGLNEMIEPIRGHASRSFRSFLEALRSEGLSLKCKIKVAHGRPALSSRLSRESIERGCDLLRRTEHLDCVTSEFVGEMVDVRTTTGEWRIRLDENPKKTIWGRTRDSEILKGVRIGSSYRLYCEETITADNVSKNEKIRYTLTRISRVKGNKSTNSLRGLFEE
ncbi:MAG: hypothetical protein Q4A64_07025 [Porphyromonadaceae bacterium]|nr:hypothetical protein [Porphyromonadaceae bacterium]